MHCVHFYFIIIILWVILSLFLYQHDVCSSKQLEIDALVRQIARWTVASQQDKSPMISLLHANYAAGYLQALELIATENEINTITNLQELRSKVYQTQDKAAQKVIKTCPNYIGKDVDKELVMMGINIKDDYTPN